VGIVAAAYELACHRFWPPAPSTEWHYFYASGPGAFAENSWARLFAHKAFAYGWFFPALTAAFALLATPLAYAFRPLKLKPGRAGLAVVIAVFLYQYFVVGLAFAGVSPVNNIGFTPSLAWPFFPAVVAVLAGVVYVATYAPVFKRLRLARWAPAAGFIGLAAAAAGSFIRLPDHRPVPTGPNVIFITFDALRGDALGAGPAAVRPAPHFDAYTREGTTFSRYVVAAPWTVPSLATLHTGLYPSVHGAGADIQLAPRFDTLAELFERRGYDTGAVVEGPFSEPRFGFAQGFRYYRSSVATDFNRRTRLYYTWLGVRPRNPRAPFHAKPRVERDARAFITRRRPDKRPFFLWVHFFDPHTPYTPRPPYDAVDAENPRSLYNGEVRYLDAVTGRLVAAAEAAPGGRDRMVLILSADHGEEFGEHGGDGHGATLFTEVLQVPLIIRAPGVWPAGAVITRQVREVDVFATLCEMCGLTPTQPTQSKSFLPLSAVNPALWDEVAFGSNPRRAESESISLSSVAVFDADGKVIVTPGRPTVYYDLGADPWEVEPLPYDEERAGRLRRAFERWRLESDELRNYYGSGAYAAADINEHLRALGYAK
jgi:arylsulfatase A-like enzyme